jgi:hypothetical protein
MPPNRKKPKPNAGPGRLTLAATGLKAVLALGLVAAVVAGITTVGGEAGRRVADRDRYAVRVADLACDAPPGTDRVTFLAEVRYLGELPETVQSVDPGLPGRLTAAFRRHPWVADVTGVTVGADGRVSVGLRFRVPVLAVAVRGEAEPRAVDRSGVLLPPGAGAGLPVLAPPVPPPTRPAGEVWDDPTVKRAAELAELHRDQRLTRVERTAKGWRLVRETGPALIVGW